MTKNILPSNTKILMFDGSWKDAINLSVDDILFDGNKILSISSEKHKLFKINLSNKDSVSFLDNDMIPYWRYNTKDKSVFNMKFNTAENIINKGLKKDHYKDGVLSQTTYNFNFPVNKLSEFKEQQHIIHPYALGLLLAEGMIGRVNRGTIRICNGEVDILENFERFSGLNHRQSVDEYHHNYPQKTNPKNEEYCEEIIRLGLNVNTEFKFIPNEYIFDSKENRLMLLRGLFDGDGTVAIREGRRVFQTTYSTVSPKLKDGLILLLETLGIPHHVSISEGRENEKRCYTISFNSKDTPWLSIKHTQRAIGMRINPKIKWTIKSIDDCGTDNSIIITTEKDIQTDNILNYNNYKGEH